jgi:hypothetical protein
MKDEALKLALEALTSGVDAQVARVVWNEYDSCPIAEAITAINRALAVQEHQSHATPPAAAQRKPLTDEQIYAMCSDFHSWSELDGAWLQKMFLDLWRAIEAAHGIKEKNNG